MVIQLTLSKLAGFERKDYLRQQQIYSNPDWTEKASLCQAINNQIKQTQSSAYEERGPVGTEH